MSMQGIVLIGAGALSRDLIDCFGAQAFAGIYVDPQFAAGSIGGLPLFTSWTDVRKVASRYILGVSDIVHRERARAAARNADLTPAAPMVSRLAIVASDAILAPGVVIGHLAVIGPAASLDEDVLVMHAAIVAHDAVVQANTVLCAGVSLGGYVRVGNNTFIGSNAVLVPGLKIGAGCHIAAGAACFHDSEPAGSWIGNPARRALLKR